MEEAAQQHNAQVHQFERDRELLESAISKLEEDLRIARRAQDSLDDQKQENVRLKFLHNGGETRDTNVILPLQLLLKETIDRLRFDLDELRGAGRKSLFFLDGSGSGTSSDRADGSLPGSVSKSLGRELARQLGGEEDEAETTEREADEDSNEEVDEIVTTRRRIVSCTLLLFSAFPSRSAHVFRPSQKKRVVKAGVASLNLSVNETTVVHDAGTQTSPISSKEMDVQTDLAAVAIELVAAPAVEIETQGAEVLEVPPEPKTQRELHEELAAGLGIDLSALQTFVDGQKDPPMASPTSFKTMSDTGPSISTRQSRPGRMSRFSSRVNTFSVQAPAFIIDVGSLGGQFDRRQAFADVPSTKAVPNLRSPVRRPVPRDDDFVRPLLDCPLPLGHHHGRLLPPAQPPPPHRAFPPPHHAEGPRQLEPVQQLWLGVG